MKSHDNIYISILFNSKIILTSLLCSWPSVGPEMSVNIKTGYVIVSCWVRAVTYLKRWSNDGMMISSRKLNKLRVKPAPVPLYPPCILQEDS
jgi:hypothetical protein